MGDIKNCMSWDNVRVETPGVSAVTVPASHVLAAHKVMRHCAMTDDELSVALVTDAETGATGWQASVGDVSGELAASPWMAIEKLADALKG